MEINIEQLESAIRDLSISINEARNMLYGGKIIPCYNKMQGSQTKCNNILSYLQAVRNKETENVVAIKNTGS